MDQAIKVRNAFGDDARFWITETGFPSVGKSEYSTALFDEFTQGQRYAISYRVFKSFDEVAAIYYFRVKDHTGGQLPRAVDGRLPRTTARPSRPSTR